MDWANGFGPLERAGVEGTGSFGSSGLARFFLQALEGIEVFEVIRPRRRESSTAERQIPDPIAAEAA